MPPAALLVLAVAPSLWWLWLIVRHDDHEREPWRLLAAALLLGALATSGVLWTRPMLEALFPAATPALEAFVVTALAEEAWKLVAFLPLLLHDELDEPLDGAVYGASVGLGFAALENVHYALVGGDALLLLQRASTATLLHAACTGCLGLCWAEGKLRRLGLGTPAWLAGGALLVVLVHGLYDLLLDGDRARAVVSLLVVLPTALALLAAKVRWARGRSHHFHPHR